MELIDAHQPDHPDDDQVEGDDIVQQSALHPGATAARNEEDHCEDDADDEKNPRDVRGNAGNSSESEHRSDERDYQKYCSPIKHIAS
jgi:hypothetical protein